MEAVARQMGGDGSGAQQTGGGDSDDPDELSDMADHDVAVDANDDDISSGFFQFQPRTLGSLFFSSSSSRALKLSANNFGFSAFHKLNRFPDDSCSFPSNNNISKEMTSVDDACSVVDASETSSESKSSLKHSPVSDSKVARGKKCHDDGNGQFQNPCKYSFHSSRVCREVDEITKPRDPQETCQMQLKSERSSRCSSSNGPKIPNSVSKPKILLVEDNKINVMLTQSMMKQLGHNIDVVNNGVEAVHVVQCRNYDLILIVITKIQELILYGAYFIFLLINVLCIPFIKNMYTLAHGQHSV
ncbi:hypothetical protein F0562_007541 [Nyssa sinensis]|uniref:Response regulatory domain-containing protein n=1 Tax=Nyssa sinensis TaxID=561372 RepID=A0A5J5A6V8_9ASTE|nr:hypothetical protein F0562_007541 [Nyssa sinensis]